MDNKLKCCIVMDLLPSYMENLISEETKRMVDTHISCCEECRGKYFMVKEENNSQNIIDSKEDQIEYDHLKKYNKKIHGLKVIIVSIIIFITIASIVLSSNYMYKKNILCKIYDNYEKLKELENYTITEECLDISYDTNERDSYLKRYYYKFGNMKREVKEIEDIKNFKKDASQYTQMKVSPNDIIEYANINTKEMITIYDTRKEYSKGEIIFHTKKGELFNIQFDIDTFNSAFSPYMIKIKTEEDRGKKYYVLQYQYSKNSGYKQIWVNKESLNIERIIEEGTSYYREKVYSIIRDCVVDSDVKIPNLENYKEV